MAEATLSLAVNASGALKSLNNVKGSLKNVEGQAEKTKRSLGGKVFGGMRNGIKKTTGMLSGKGGLIAGIAGVAAGVIGVNKIRNKLDMADALAKNARQANLSVEALSEMRYAANQMGVDAGALDGAMAKMNRRLGDFAATGKGAAVKALKQLGISQQDLNTKFKSGEDRFDAVIDGLMKIEDPAARAKAAFDIGGVALEKLTSQMTKGGEGFKNLRKEANEVGAVISTDFAESAERVNDKWDKLQQTFGGISTQIADKLLPKLEPLLDKLLKNAPAIVDGVVNAFSGFMSVIEGLMPIIDAIWPIFEALFNVIKIGWDAAKPAIEAMAPAIKSMAEIIASAIEGIPDAVSGFVDWITNLPTFIGEKLDQMVEFFKALPGRVIDYFVEMKNGLIQQVKEMLDWMPDWVKKKLGMTEDAFQGTADKLVNNSIVPDMIGDIKKEFMGLSDIVAPVDVATNLVTKGFDNLTADVGMNMPSMGNMSAPSASGGAPVFNFNVANVNGAGDGVTQDDLRQLAAGLLRSASQVVMNQQRVGGVLNA